MTSASRVRFQKVLIEKVTEVPERYPGYQREVLEKIATIVGVERQHIDKHTNVQQKIGDQIEALGRSIRGASQ